VSGTSRINSMRAAKPDDPTVVNRPRPTTPRTA
jgi:hypothetical protein